MLQMWVIYLKAFNTNDFKIQRKFRTENDVHLLYAIVIILAKNGTWVAI